MAGGSVSSDEHGLEGRATTKSLGKATQENKMKVELQLGATAATLNGELVCTVSKGKQALQPSEYGHPSRDKNIQSSTSWTVGSFEDGRSKTYGPCPGQSNLQGAAKSAAPDGPAVVEPDVSSFVCNDLVRAEPRVGSTVSTRQSGALIVASPNTVYNQPSIAPNVDPNVVPLAPTLVRTDGARFGVAPVQLDVAPHAQRNGDPPVPPQPNAALIAVADAQPNAAAVDAPPLVFDFDVNAGLRRSRIKPLRICDIESEGHIWSNISRS